MAGIGTAQASDGPHCGEQTIQLSVDGGQTWQGNGRIGDPAPLKITVRLKDKVHKGCTYDVSLASYSAEGPTWPTSGTQALLGWDTTTLSKDNPEDTLDVSDHAPQCFGQLDLYGNGNKYDGSDSDHALPHYPDTPTPYDLIAYWNGGSDSACTPAPSPTPSDTTTSPAPSDTPTTPSESPSATPSETPSETPSATPSDSTSPTPSDTPSQPGSPTPSGSPSTTAPVGATAAPSPSSSGTGRTTTPVVKPVSSSGNLAETGGNGSQDVIFAVGGAVLLVAGGGAVYLTRRRRSASH